MAKLIAALGFLWSSLVCADQIEYLGRASFDSTYKFEKTRFGGISGLAWDASENILWAVSDDRGKLNPPRLYKLSLKVNSNKGKFDFDVKVEAVYEIKEKGKTLPVFDLEGIALLPWGNLLLSSEGDDGSRPRRPQRLIDVKMIESTSEESLAAKAAGLPVEKPHGKWIRDFELPPWYVSEKSGKPTQGLRTNLGFEGLAMALNGSSVVAAAEYSLTQDIPHKPRFLQFDMVSAWVLKPTREWIYSLDPDPAGAVWLLRGISEILPVEGDRWWVMERGLQVGVPPLTTQIYEVELKNGLNINPLPTQATKAADLPELKKRLVLDLDKFSPDPLHENFEAMTWGPVLPDGRRLLVLSNDNNFQNGSATYFVFAAVTLDKSTTSAPSKSAGATKGH